MFTFECGGTKDPRIPTLFFNRAPLYLRLAHDPKAGNWDSLDLLEDEPAAGEELTAWRRASCARMHVLAVDGKGRRKGRWLQTGRYEFVLPQPDDATMRDREAWRAWCLARQASEAGEVKS